ncbi:hypothetical protein [Emcibacter nanhaiensis]|uniref:Uncharacterized protein n=1 Tax=Emcibacter nanhaiensis TaxID=1505037 RepID=A0A501PSE6_9PROT|nr:hypothetical protein [Emcibacter nanhaiensis]TPD63017.1 hypothetical protein FIV46_02755 [Emcibacter nanhaiensis]
MTMDFHDTTSKIKKVALLGAISVVAMGAPAYATTLGTMLSVDDLNSLVTHTHSTTCSHWQNAPMSQKEQMLSGGRFDTIIQSGAPVASSVVADGFADGQVSRPASTGANASGPQVVYLDFDSATTGTYSRTFKENADGTGADVTLEFDEHIYTQAEREYIQQRFQADYAGFNYQFVLEAPEDGVYGTMFFNANMPGEGASSGPAGINVADGGTITSVTFGIAESIDFRNLNRGDNANIDGNAWAILSDLGIFTALTGLADTPENIAAAATIQSAQTGAHELGHTVGLRHYEAWGPIGEGLPTTGTPPDDAFLPTYTGPRNADETTLHLMGSGYSAGLSFADSVVTDRFFSERSAIKLTFNEQGQVVDETDGDHSWFDTAQEVKLEKLVVPNTLVEGDNANKRWLVDAISIEGSISEIEQLDFYAFEGEEGDIFNLEVISLVNWNNDDFFDSILYIFDEDMNLITYSDDEFESPDSFVFDFIMDYTGIFYAVVSGFDYTGTGFDEWSTGNYQLFVTRTVVSAPAAGLLLAMGLGFLVRARRKKFAN